jgi:hypothetical protein
MYGPELKAWRESVGLSATGLGHLLDVKTRTIGYWEGFEDPLPPAGVLEDISKVVSALENRLRILGSQIAATSAPILLAYRTLEDVKAMDPDSYRVGVTPMGYRAVLWANRCGRPLRYLEVPEYVRWLKANGIADSLESRALWAQGFPPINQRNAPNDMLVGDH